MVLPLVEEPVVVDKLAATQAEEQLLVEVKLQVEPLEELQLAVEPQVATNDGANCAEDVLSVAERSPRKHKILNFDAKIYLK